MKYALTILIVVGLLFSCAGPSKEPVMNNQVSESGDTVWTASYFNAAAQMDKAFKFVGSQDKSDQRVGRKYYVYDAGDGHFIYIVEIKIRGTYKFPKDYNPLLDRDQDPNNPNILYVDDNFSVWKGMRERSYNVVSGLGVEIPECKIMVEQAKISPSRSGGAWIVMSVPSTCERSVSEVEKSLSFYTNTVDFR